MSVPPTPRQVGTRIPRVEDGRYLHGRGSYVGDLPRVTKTLDVCFVRSRLAHARIKRVTGPAGLDARLLWTSAQLGDLNGLSAISSLPGYQNHVQPLIASEVVRYVGEIVAIALGESRHEAEDLADQVLVDVEPLPAVITIAEAIATGAPLANDSIADNVFHRETIAAGDLDAARQRASVVFAERFETARCSGVPLEPRGALACWDEDRERLTIWTSTQVPHLLRSQLAVCLGLPERSIRVVAPDVGGGFGIKASLYPEDVLISALAIRLRRPVRWLSDRREDLIASWFAREHTYEVEAYAASDGKLLGLRVVVAANVGAYAPVPWTAAMEATMAAAVLPGPYNLVNYRADVLSVCSNTTVLGPYRGVGRPGACFVMERVMDELATVWGSHQSRFACGTWSGTTSSHTATLPGCCTTAAHSNSRFRPRPTRSDWKTSGAGRRRRAIRAATSGSGSRITRRRPRMEPPSGSRVACR